MFILKIFFIALISYVCYIIGYLIIYFIFRGLERIIKKLLPIRPLILGLLCGLGISLMCRLTSYFFNLNFHTYSVVNSIIWILFPLCCETLYLGYLDKENLGETAQNFMFKLVLIVKNFIRRYNIHIYYNTLVNYHFSSKEKLKDLEGDTELMTILKDIEPEEFKEFNSNPDKLTEALIYNAHNLTNEFLRRVTVICIFGLIIGTIIFQFLF